MGNRSIGPAHGAKRLRVRLPGFLVQGTLAIPRAHTHALWLLPWVERLICGETLDQLVEAPPWPAPNVPLVTSYLLRTLLDLRWVVPDWSSDAVTVPTAFKDAYAAEGRTGLARQLFDAELVEGEWWADALGGVILSRQTAQQFDWDLVKRADVILEATTPAQQLLDASTPALPALLNKLGGVAALRGARRSAFLVHELTAGARKDLLFTLYGDAPRLLPSELGELEPSLLHAAPELFAAKRPEAASAPLPTRRVPHIIERLSAALERLPADPSMAGPARMSVERCARVRAMCEEAQQELSTWLARTTYARPVYGPDTAQRAALGRLLSGSAVDEPCALVVLMSPVLDSSIPALTQLCALLEAAPTQSSFLILYGCAHPLASASPQAHLDRWYEALATLAPRLAPRVTVAATRQSFDARIVLTSAGGWMFGSWDACSTAPGLACSLIGQDPAIAAQLLKVLSAAVPAALTPQLAPLAHAFDKSSSPPTQPDAAVARLCQAAALAHEAALLQDQGAGHLWQPAIRALRRAWHPFVTAAHLQILDAHALRAGGLAILGPANQTILYASASTVADTSSLWRAVVTRTRSNVEILKAAPLSAHGTLVVVDGLRGVLAGGDLSARETERTVAILFDAPVIARTILAGALDRDRPPQREADAALPWIAYGDTRWSMQRAGAQDEDEAESVTLMDEHLWEQAARETTPSQQTHCYEALKRRFGATPLGWLREEGERRGLLHVSAQARWRPWYEQPLEDTTALLSQAQRALEAVRPAPALLSRRDEPLIQQLREGMVALPAGSFMMGDERVPEERPRHRVVISKGFALAKTPVTQGVWVAVMGRLPHLRDVERDADKPIIHLSLDDIAQFLKRLNGMVSEGYFDLPTEAEWEYACRAGADTRYAFGDDPEMLEEYAWTKRNANARLQRVGLLKPNAWGLYDMHGLIYETMRDDRRSFQRGEVIDPCGPLTTGGRVARGGCWSRWPVDAQRPAQEHFRCASRQTYEKGARCSIRLAWYKERHT